ncbi:MAG TPA: universal stress protein [Ideonella sp.]|uniref:universal stress protein n=1 Tax=Ideonella sp. TaxID=1929293 RepID=UPI002E32EE62|nr:universal stress protein [Ideonella sp.]HEX5685025.1 universal stress protein [Ideonella sp.]
MYTKILVPIDGSPTSNRGLDEAIKLARLTGATIKLLHVIDLTAIAMAPETGGLLTTQMVQLLTQGGQQILADAEGRVKSAGLGVESELIESPAVRVCDQVVDEARRWRAELIVIGTHGRCGVGRLMIGSNAEQIARLAPAPVLLVRATEGTAG